MIRKTYRSMLRAALAAIVTITTGAAALHAAPAFPGAEGFGANATGGRAGSVYIVTNLNDSGAGSFRDAVSASNRIVVFAVGGIITLKSPVSVKGNITIAGQTAPGDGIILYGDRLSFSGADNVICRYLRIREGINGDGGTDAISFDKGKNLIFDHLSASWGRDETFSMNGSGIENVTIQDSIIGQGLLVHSAGGLIQPGGGVSIFRTLYIDQYMRNPKTKGIMNYQNNVVYNWGSGGGYIPGGDSAGMSYANVIGCYFIAGPNSPSSPFTSGNKNYQLYQNGNLEDMNRNGSLDGVTPALSRFSTLDLKAAPFDYPAPLVQLTAAESVAHIARYAGASLKRDHADKYMINELLSSGTAGAHIYNESEIGGVGTIDPGIPAADTDNDGMPDWWESAAGTNPSVNDAMTVNADGYTNIEKYINAITDSGVPVAAIASITPDSGSAATDGITSSHNIQIHGTAPAGAVVTLSRVDTGVLGTATADASGNWTFDYSGTTLEDRYYAFAAVAGLTGGKTSAPSRVFVVQVDSAAAAAPEITGLVTTPSYVFNGTSEPYAQISVSVQGGSEVATATADGYGTWSAAFTGTPPASGVHTFAAIATDRAGNPSAASAAYVVDTSLAAPVFTGISTDSGTAGDFITNDATLNLIGTAQAGATVTISRTGVGVLGTVTADVSGAWTYDYTATTLPDGKHAFTATASAGGAASPVSVPFVVTVDKTAPTVSGIRRQTPSSVGTTASTLVYRVTFGEAVSGVAQGNFSLNKSNVTGDVTGFSKISDTAYEVTVSNVAGDGTIRLDLKASQSGIVDVAGNSATASYTSGQTYTIRLAGSGAWASTDSALWNDSNSWEGGEIASGVGATADFSTLDISDDVVATLDTARTVGRLVFADADEGTPGAWTVSGTTAGALTLDMGGSTTPTLQVAYTTGDTDPNRAAAGADYPVLLDLPVSSANGLNKTGWGTAILNKIGTLTGVINITQGRLKLGPGAVLNTTSAINLSVSTQFEVAGGTFSTTADVNQTFGTGGAVIVSGGTASFKKIKPSNSRNGLIKVSGGIATIDEILIQRSGDSAGNYDSGVVVTGGTATIGTLGLGTADSWGALTVDGGKLTITDALWNGYQTSGGRGGQIRVRGGELVLTDTTNGLVMSRKNGSNANNVAELHISGGTVTAKRIALGYDATVNAGSATINLTGGALYLGNPGLVKNGSFTTNINLTDGTLGADEDWSTTVPMVVTNATGDITIKAANAAGAARDITLGGVLSGSGTMTKTGAGTLSLTAVNTHTGPIIVSEGTLNVEGRIAAGTETVTIKSGASLTGSGTISRAVVLDGGGFVVSGTPIAVTSLTKQSAGAVPVVLADASLSGRTRINIATFDSTNLTNADFEPLVQNGVLFFADITASALDFVAYSLDSDNDGTGVTGGGTATVALVSSADSLKAALESPSAAVVVVSGQLDLASVGGAINVASNKTILGQNSLSTISGRLNLGASTSNVLIVGVNITNAAGNGLVLDGAKDVYVAHCTFFDCDGALLSALNGADNITAAWNEFYYTTGFTGKRSATKIGAAAETKPLNVTLHHNYWGAGCSADMPVSNFGYIHMYDNYLYAQSNTTATVAGAQSQLLSAHNVYQNMAAPIVKAQASGSLAPGLVRVVDNSYVSTTGTADPGADKVFVPAKSYVLDTALAVGADVPQYAGNTSGAASFTPAVAGSASIINPNTAVIPHGGSFMLMATAQGVTPVSYQWNLNNFPVESATNATYMVTDAKATTHGGAYSVSIGVETGETIVSGSSIVTIAAVNAPVILNQPVSQSIKAGGATLFAVLASSETPMTYQWQKDGVNIYRGTSATLHITDAYPSTAGSYRVIVTNESGSITSDAATLTVTDKSGGATSTSGGAPSWWFFGAGALLVLMRFARKLRGPACALAILLAGQGAFAPTKASAQASDGTWANATGGDWTDTAKWAGGKYAEGVGKTANFTNDITADTTILVGGPLTIGNLKFADAATSSAGGWIIAPSAANVDATITLAVASGAPTINAGALGTGKNSIIRVPLTGTQGLTHNGTGEVVFSGSTSIQGTVLLGASSSKVTVGDGGYWNLGTDNVLIGQSAVLLVNGGTFITEGTIQSGTVKGDAAPTMTVQAGYARVGQLKTNTDSNSVFTVTGGTLSVGYVNLQRSGGNATTFTRGFIVKGGYVDAENIGVATNNSYSSMSVEGGTVCVSGTFVVGYQVTSGRGATLRMTNGRLISTDTVDGLVLSKSNVIGANTGTNSPGALEISGGVATLEKITLGYDTAINAGSATVTVSGGALYLGSGGIVKNGASGLSTSITLSGGTLGAKGTWTLTHPVTLTADSTICAANEQGAAVSVIIDSVISGAGGLIKTGTGTLTLTADNTFGGAISINEGILEIAGQLASTPGAITVNAGGYLSGTAAIAWPVVLNGGGVSVGNAPISLSTVTKQGDGVVPIHYTGAAPGESAVTLVTFDSTNLTNADFEPFDHGDEQLVVKVRANKLELVTWHYTPPDMPEGVTGSGGVPPVTVTTAAGFKTALEAAAPALVVVSGAIDLSTVGGVVNLGPNKTIAGMNAAATVSGKLNIPATSGNVAMIGLNIANPGSDGLVIDGAKDVYVTHCTFFDCNGTLLSAVNGADNITISWNEFYYTPAFPGQRSAMVLGKAGAETKPLHVYLHHNYWGAGCATDMPASNYGYIHMYDNYLHAQGGTTATVVGAQSQVLAARNVYQDMAATVAIASASGTLAPGRLLVMDNIYVDTTGTPAAGGDIVFVPQYPFVLDAPATIGAIVPQYAGNYAGMNSIAPDAIGAAEIVASGTVAPLGGSLTLIASTPGLTGQSYQWNLNNLPIPGATGAGYMVRDANAATHAGPYSVSVTLATGETLVSAATNVTVGDGIAPTIIAQPVSLVVSPKTTAIFSVVAAGDGPLQYQWQKNGAAISGATSPALHVTDVKSSDAATYQVVVTNNFGSATSEPASLSLHTDPSVGGGGGGAPSLWLLGALAALAISRALASRRRNG